MFGDKLPDFGRVTKFNARMSDGTKCRWCNRPQSMDPRGFLVCTVVCDVPLPLTDKYQAPEA